MIDEYVRAIEEAIEDLGKLVRSSALYKEERETDFLLLRGEVKFANGSQLHFREFVQLKQGLPPNRYKYAYHYQNADETVIFRYDNARHYLELSTAPHHKHVGEDKALATNPPDLQTVLNEIKGMMKI